MSDDGVRKEYLDAVRDIAGRIAARGVHLRGDETSAEITELEDAIEEFESVVEAHGGDLMVDEPPPGEEGEPDDPLFRLPKRPASMSVAAYLDRLAEAADTIREQR